MKESLYILDKENNPVFFGGIEKFREWFLWFKNTKNRILKEQFIGKNRQAISLRFIGADMGYGITDKPILYEVVVFQDNEVEICEEFSDKAEAEKRFDEIVSWGMLLYSTSMSDDMMNNMAGNILKNLTVKTVYEDGKEYFSLDMSKIKDLEE